jgi:phosphoglycolate phosphatase
MALVVFDLDGTLIDSAPDIRAAVNKMLAGEGLMPLDLPTIISFIGNGLPKLVSRVVEHVGLDPARHAELTEITLGHYSAAATDLTRPYEGVVEALQAMQDAGHRLALCTNKPEAPSRAILNDLGLEHFFDSVVGGDTLTVRKPDPKPLLHIVGQSGETKVLYVGDSEVDAETAKRADIRFALFTKGYRKSPVHEIPHQDQFNSFDDLPRLVEDAFAG